MDVASFEKRLHEAFDKKVWVERDRRDHCMVVWDRSRSGTPYPAYKVSCEHNLPVRLGTPREAYETDVQALRRMDWAEKYNRRKGAGRQVMREFYLDPEEQKHHKLNADVREVTNHQAKPYAFWRAGVKNTISLKPSSPSTPCGGMKNRHQDGRRRRQKLVG